jgi:arsenate reductase-like glutaredoxin family protein
MKAYGLKKCSTCQKALDFLAQKKVKVVFTDHSETPPTPPQVAAWSKALGGWEKMVNRAGYTWRGLPQAETENLTEAKAVALAVKVPVADPPSADRTCGRQCHGRLRRQGEEAVLILRFAVQPQARTSGLCHAGGAAFALAADVVAADHLHLDARLTHAVMGFGVAFHHHGVARPEGEHVAAHGVELLVRHMDKVHAP